MSAGFICPVKFYCSSWRNDDLRFVGSSFELVICRGWRRINKSFTFWLKNKLLMTKLFLLFMWLITEIKEFLWLFEKSSKLFMTTEKRFPCATFRLTNVICLHFNKMKLFVRDKGRYRQRRRKFLSPSIYNERKFPWRFLQKDGEENGYTGGFVSTWRRGKYFT